MKARRFAVGRRGLRLRAVLYASAEPFQLTHGQFIHDDDSTLLVGSGALALLRFRRRRTT